MEVILHVLLANFEGDHFPYFETEASGHQTQEVHWNNKITFCVVGERNTMEVRQLLLETLTPLPQDGRDMLLNAVKKIVEDNKNPILYEPIWEIAVIASWPEVVRHLLDVNAPMLLTETHAAFVIEKGAVAMWNMFPELLRHTVVSEPDANLLRQIVSSGKLDMVEEAFKLGPALMEFVGEKEGREILLLHLRRLKKDSAMKDKYELYEAIRSLLVGGMVQNHNLEMQDIREILMRSEVEAYEMSFHLPQFKSNSKNGCLADYVRGLKTMNAEFLRFERILKYAKFPELSGQELFTSSEDMRQDHSEVIDVLDWLQNRGAQQVLRLSVGDRLHCPHTDEDVTACVNTFGVRALNWRKLDLYLKNMTDSPIEELHLYSSGNPSVHDQWLSRLPRFKQLKKLFVYVVNDVIKPRLLKQITEDLESDLNELNRIQGYPWASEEEDGSGSLDGNPERHPKIKVSQIWVREPDNLAMVDQSLDNRTSDVLSLHLAKFVKRFCDYNREHSKIRKTKVALIDSGVVAVGRYGENLSDDIYSTVARQIVGGTSLVSRDGEETNWYHATEPHGTQMAALICTLNPLCNIYVIKVAESNASGITGNNVAKAIEWARDKGVDIISLSLVAFSDPDNKMFEAIKAAREDDIVITCSTSDEGNVSARSVGENNENVLSIAACDRWGNLLPQSRRTGFNYQFLGHNVHVGQVPYLESREIIEGSSVSTAIAAGMASLILACTRISSPTLNLDLYEEDGRRRSWRCDAVKKRFDSMSEGKWVILDNLCGHGELRNYYDFERLVKDTFRY
ncbi:hypothetical protein TrVFT333_001329 [Trichoderma virens FT-333]|nr:hypothetical protein TrVFT333_001329 [Trichoderma virens FT-333]